MIDILWGAIGVLLMATLGFVGFTFYLTWQHEAAIRQIIPAIVQLQQAAKPPKEVSP